MQHVQGFAGLAVALHLQIVQFECDIFRTSREGDMQLH